MRIPLCFFVTFAALSSLGANPFSEAESVGGELGKEALESSETGIAVSDLEAFVTTLASDQFEGRGTGDPGERMATEYFATFLEGLGLKPEGDDSAFFQPFEFRAGMELKGEKQLFSESPCRSQFFYVDQFTLTAAGNKLVAHRIESDERNFKLAKSFK